MQLPTEREYTSFRIKNPELWKKVKIAAIENDLGVSEFVEKALSEYMATVAKPVDPMVEKATKILNQLQNRDFVVTGGMDINLAKKGIMKKNTESLADALSNAMIHFERVINLEKNFETEHLSKKAAEHLIAIYDKCITSNAITSGDRVTITEGPGLISKVEQLREENERLRKELEQLKKDFHAASVAYEEFSAKSR